MANGGQIVTRNDRKHATKFDTILAQGITDGKRMRYEKRRDAWN